MSTPENTGTTRQPGRGVAAAAAALLAGLLAFSSCGRSDRDVLAASISDNDRLLVVEVDTCNEPSTEVDVVESADDVLITANSDSSFGCGGRDDCLDVIEVTLDEPLGDRTVTDGNSGEAVDVQRR